MRADSSILHVDLDAFYASVEQRDDPSLRGRPVVVGGLGPRGVVAAASYEARRFGIGSAMPMARARRACRDAVFLAPRFDAYGEASRAVMAILRSYSPLVEPIASDEAFVDVAGARRRVGTGRECAVAIRVQILDETRLVASVGVARTKLLAKLASDLSKPDGLLEVAPDRELEFLHPLPVERLWGVGPATSRKLARLGVTTIGELAARPERTLVDVLGEAQGTHLHALAWNRDDRPVVVDRAAKSIGHEETFPVDIHAPDALAHELVRLADGVGSRLRAAGMCGRTVVLKVRFADFRTITRSRTLPGATDVSATVAATAQELLAAVDVRPGVRLLGVSVQQLGEVAQQGALFGAPTGRPSPNGGSTSAPDPPGAEGPDAGTESRSELGPVDLQRQRRLEHAVDEVRARFGRAAVGPASPRVGREQIGEGLRISDERTAPGSAPDEGLEGSEGTDPGEPGV